MSPLLVGHVVITPTCRANRGEAGAWQEAVFRLCSAYGHSVSHPNNAGVEWHLKLERVEPTIGGAA